MPERAVFLDRDGTINEEVGFLNNPDQLKLITGTAEALKLLNNMGFLTVVISNQSGIARGFLTEDRLLEINRELTTMLRESGAIIDKIYYCPHHPDAEISRYHRDCDCRKPNPGMLRRAAEELSVDLQKSFVIGDKISDLTAGFAAGCRTVLVLTGYGRKSQQRIGELSFAPDFIAQDLLDAARWIRRKTLEVSKTSSV